MSTDFIESKKLHKHNDNIQLMALDLDEETGQIIEYFDPLKTASEINLFGPLKNGGPVSNRCSTLITF